jgi:hypothetical protein
VVGADTAAWLIVIVTGALMAGALVVDQFKRRR